MKKLVLLILIIILSGCSKKNDVVLENSKADVELENSKTFETQEINRQMYVSASEGLRVRDTPNLDGEKIALLDYLTEVTVEREDKDIISISGVDGKWTFVKSGNIEGWVFGGYLSSYKPSQETANETSLIGTWIRYSNVFYLSEDGFFYEIMLESSSTGSGTWKTNDDKLIITITHRGEDYAEWTLHEEREYLFSFTDDTLIIKPLDNGSDAKKTELIYVRTNGKIHPKYEYDAIIASYQKYIDRFGSD